MTDFQSIIFYIISFSLPTFFYRSYVKHNKKPYLIASFLIPFLIGGLRYMVGTDYEMYTYMSVHDVKVDVGFSLLSKISNSLGGGNWIFALYSFLTLLFFYLGLNNTNKESRTLILCIYLFMYFTSSFNIMRQMLSVSIFFYAIKFIKDKKIIKYYVFTLVAALFHASALILLPLYPFFSSKKKITRALCIVLMIIASITLESIIGGISSISGFEHYSMYSNYTERNFNNYSFFLELIILFSIILFSNSIKRYDKFSTSLLFIYTLGVVLTFSGFFSPFIKRIALYFCIPSVVLLGEIPQAVLCPKYKFIIRIGIIIFIITKFILSTYVLRQGNLIPYNII